MATFTIDFENNIIAHAGVPASADPQQLFATEKELAKLAADWPGARLIEVWNSFAGVAPFDDLQPVKKFTNRPTAVRRIWQAIARLSPPWRPRMTSRRRSRGNPTNVTRRARLRTTAGPTRRRKSSP